MHIFARLFCCCLVAVLVPMGGCKSKSGNAASGPDLPQLAKATPAIKSLRLVPIGDFSKATLEDLAAYYRDKLGLDVQVWEPMPLDQNVFDPLRQQASAEKLLRSLSRHGIADTMEETVIIAVTSRDIFEEHQPDWIYVFSYRDGDHAAVMSTARMDEKNYGVSADPQRTVTRLRKMMTRQIGILCYRLDRVSDPNSVLCQSIMSLDDLDRIREDL
jgi:predicted Zn-dependent protease